MISEGSLLGGSSGTSDCRESNWLARLLILVWSYLPVLGRLPLEELRSLGLRIRAAQKIQRAFADGSPIVPKEFECFLVAGSRSHIRAYRLDMQRVKEQFPFATTLDLFLATRAWKLGTQTCAHNSGTESHRSSSSEFSPAVQAPQVYAAANSSAIDQT